MPHDDELLIERLREAGHDDVADALRDRALATQLRDSGHDHLAERLEGPTPAAGSSTESTAGAEPATPVPGVTHGHELAALIGQRADRSRALAEQVLGAQPTPKENTNDR